MMFSIIDDMDKRERDYSIDFVKGVAILFVILLHNMPNESIYSIAYIGQAVPLFLLVSSYLTYGGFQRKGFNGYFSARNVKKMLDRVFLPFFLLIFSQCAIFYLLKGGVDWQRLYMQGGFGPGSYYPWIYLQCWLILPFVIFLINANFPILFARYKIPAKDKTARTIIKISHIFIILIALFLPVLFPIVQEKSCSAYYQYYLRAFIFYTFVM